MQDHYSILGLLPSAELAVIKGAYKALMTKYHPDKHPNDKEFFHQKVLEIRQAYDVLKDPVKRAAYDEQLGSEKVYTAEEQDVHEAQDDQFSADKEQWEYALKYYPELELLESLLSQLSPNLAMQFRLLLIENRNFSQAETFAFQLEEEYLQRFFGNDSNIKAFAYELLMAGNRDAAKELNKAVNFLGDDLDAYKLILQIKCEFDLDDDIYTERENQFDTDPWKSEPKNSRKTGLTLDSIPFIWALSVTIFILFILTQPHSLGDIGDVVLFMLFIFGCYISYKTYRNETKKPF